MALTTNLQAYYKFDESSGNASDSSGNGNTLTNNNTATFSAGKINNGADLEDSSSQYFSAADSASLDITGDLSFSGWVKVESAPALNTQHSVFNKDGIAAGTRSYSLWYRNEGGTLKFETYLFQSDATYDHIQWNVDLGTATWKHVALVVTVANAAATECVLYIDGISQGNGTVINNGGITSIQNGTAELRLGRGHTTEYFDGMFDEFGLWSRALTQAEVIQLYNSTAGLAYPFTIPTDRIMIDTNVATANLGTSGSATWNHTVASGGVLYVYLAIYYATDTLTAITFDGVAMTLIKKETSNTRSIYCYGILNPTTGSAKVVSVTWTSGQTLYGASVSYTGVNTSGFSTVTPVESHNAGATNNTSLSITTVVDNSVVLGMGTADNNSITTYTGVVNIGALTTMVPLESTPLLVTPAGAKTVTIAAGTDWYKLIAFVAEPATASSFIPRIMMS